MGAIIKGGEKGLPLFEYAKKFENYEHYEDLDDFFIHCLETNGFEAKENAQFMGLSQQGFSGRMSRVIHENTPRFSLTHQHLYVLRTGDPRPASYLDWLTKRAKTPDKDVVLERLERAIQTIPRLLTEAQEIASALKRK